MSSLPDELWRRILEMGVESGDLSYKELCCVSISCRRFHRLSSEDSLWNRLISSHFPQTKPLLLSPPSSKSLYKLRFERDKERRIAAHRRVLFRKQSQISEHARRLRDIETRVAHETIKAKETAQELYNLRRVRQASVSLNVWQPEVVRGRQRQMVEQCDVPAEFRIRAVEMELMLCKQQIVGLEKSYKDEKRRLKIAKEELASMNYHPVQQHTPLSGGENEHNVKRKKLKICNS
ncbi:F-box protein SKIP24 [Abrus precatorius]|uniref:F-box protein SKIP24 n=1 Tax=Abrus precatorius TaxID=3816 RepID=A0A8B8LC43_ABRPR|nr:F-box protein SKIP24 [Abrus precatorius]